MSEIDLGGIAYSIERFRLKQYLILQQKISTLSDAVEGGDNGSIVKAILDVLCFAIGDINRGDLLQLPWYEIVNAYTYIAMLNSIPQSNRFAILRKYDHASKTTDPWTYFERTLYLWTHMIASAYGWSKKTIENLWPEEAVAYLQEILADQQYDREFYYSLSDAAYSYDPATKKAKFRPMERPAWMVLRTEPIKTQKINIKALPSGNVQYPKEDRVYNDRAQADDNSGSN